MSNEGNIKTANQEFTYSNSKGENKVVMGYHYGKAKWFVDVMNEYSLTAGSSNWYESESDAQKRFDSIKKRTS